MRRLTGVFLLFLLWPIAGQTANETADETAGETARGPAAALPSVVSLLPLWSGRPANPEEPEGSAVVIGHDGDGTLLVTADHVLGDAVRFRIRTAEGVAYPALILGRDRPSDLALLRAQADLPALEFADPPALGAKVCAIGNAFGLGLSLTCGVLSAKGRAGVGFNRVEDFLQSDAAVNPGMSGGALLDSDGRLIGLLSAIFTKGSDADIGVNFSVSSALIQAALPDLASGGPVAWPHVDLLFRPPEVEAEGPLGPVVMRVPKAGAAAAADLQPKDRILHANLRRVRNLGEWRSAIALAQPGETITLEVWRSGAGETLSLVVPGQ